MGAQLLLYALAALCFAIGILDLPQFSTLRCISAGMMLLTLAMIIR